MTATTGGRGSTRECERRTRYLAIRRRNVLTTIESHGPEAVEVRGNELTRQARMDRHAARNSETLACEVVRVRSAG